MREEERRRRKQGKRERERVLYRGSEGSASAPFGGGIIIAQRVPAGVAFSTKVLHGRDMRPTEVPASFW
jgi:hypothetical protein